ncbi:MAG: WG repeat-containing protein [Deltaproteobacteria bacterium]|nr:WG repeat-containing protein [Deltaproteobacteria bacterium]
MRSRLAKIAAAALALSAFLVIRASLIDGEAGSPREPAPASGQASSSAGLFPVPRRAESGLYGYAAADGSWAVSPGFLAANPFTPDGRAWVRQEDGYVSIDPSGTPVPGTRIAFDAAGEFNPRGLASGRAGLRFGVLSRDGRWIMEPSCAFPIYFAEDGTAPCLVALEAPARAEPPSSASTPPEPAAPVPVAPPDAYASPEPPDGAPSPPPAARAYPKPQGLPSSSAEAPEPAVYPADPPANTKQGSPSGTPGSPEPAGYPAAVSETQKSVGTPSASAETSGTARGRTSVRTAPLIRSPESLSGPEGLWGLIGPDGKWLVEPRFGAPFSFGPGGLAAAKAEDGRWGFIDREGEWAIAPRFRMAFNFTENGLASVEESEGRSGYVRSDGSWAVYPVFPRSLDFGPNGLAAACSMQGLWGFIGSDGRWKVEPKFTQTASQFAFGLAPAMDAGGMWGYIDETGAWALEPRFSQAYQFMENGLAAASSADGAGLVARDGSWAVAPVFRDVGNWGGDLTAPAQASSGGWGFISRGGGWAVRPGFRFVSPFNDRLGLAPARSADGLWGVIDMTGGWVIEPSCRGTEIRDDGLILCVLPDGRGNRYLNRRGECRVPLGYDAALDG